MNAFGTLGRGATSGGMADWTSFDSCSGETVSFLNASGSVNVSSTRRVHGWGFGEKRGERGSGTFEAAHGELKRGINFRADRAAVRRGDWGLSIEEAS
jgi:hypothetical protein